jgi:hypothetical protein
VSSGGPDRRRAEGRPPRRYGALLLSAVVLLAVQGVFPPGRVQQVLVAGLAGVCLVLAVRAADLSPAVLRWALLLASAVLTLSILRAVVGGIGEGAARLCIAALLALGPPAVAIGVVRDLRSSGRVELSAISGVLVLYLLIGMAFAFLYGGLDRVGREPFFTSGVEATISLCLYFSFTTLTTVGYGDLTAGTDLGRTLAIFEALIGQIYLVTVVSLLVGNLRRPVPVAPPPRADR